MRIEQEFEIAVGIERMYEVINDVGAIGHCVAGVKDVVVMTNDISEWKIEVRAGFMARVFKLRGEIVERRPPSCIRFLARGQDLELSGQVDLTALSNALTLCSVVVEANVTGPFANVVDLMAKTQQQRLIQATIENVRQMLDAHASLRPSPPAHAPME